MTVPRAQWFFFTIFSSIRIHWKSFVAPVLFLVFIYLHVFVSWVLFGRAIGSQRHQCNRYITRSSQNNSWEMHQSFNLVWSIQVWLPNKNHDEWQHNPLEDINPKKKLAIRYIIAHFVEKKLVCRLGHQRDAISDRSFLRSLRIISGRLILKRYSNIHFACTTQFTDLHFVHKFKQIIPCVVLTNPLSLLLFLPVMHMCTDAERIAWG